VRLTTSNHSPIVRRRFPAPPRLFPARSWTSSSPATFSS
jgi:hypothetical protein